MTTYPWMSDHLRDAVTSRLAVIAAREAHISDLKDEVLDRRAKLDALVVASLPDFVGAWLAEGMLERRIGEAIAWVTTSKQPRKAWCSHFGITVPLPLGGSLGISYGRSSILMFQKPQIWSERHRGHHLYDFTDDEVATMVGLARTRAEVVEHWRSDKGLSVRISTTPSAGIETLIANQRADGFGHGYVRDGEGRTRPVTWVRPNVPEGWS